ncbi:MAG: protein-glutamate O-methyltransferase CheR [Spirochaetia bacterium]|nr:protein-glutamate O-methyltransferase CheR [Spirochaetia bacterium]
MNLQNTAFSDIPDPQITGIPDITDIEFEKFRKLIYELAGVSMNDSKKSLIRGRLLRRIRYYGFKSYKEYYKLIQEPTAEAKEELHILVDLLTTHETYFFREPEHFKYLAEYLTLHKKDLREFNVWIAASSSGEEAYTAAMVIHDILGDDIPWSIEASDVSRGIIEIAASGLYPLERADKIPEQYLKKYCRKGVKSMEGLFKISNVLMNRITFKQINLIEEIPLRTNFDLVFLRNVMIYFNQETKKTVVSHIAERMKPGAILIVGHSESLNGLNTGLKWIKQSVYQKV